MSTLLFGILGDIQSGKSTLINCILQRHIATVGDGTATTHVAVKYVYGKNEHVEYCNKDGSDISIGIEEKLDVSDKIERMIVFLDVPILKYINIIDTPGFGYNRHDDNIAERSIEMIDYAIMVFSNVKAIGGEESGAYKNAKCLQKYGVPYYTILNCRDASSYKWIPDYTDNVGIADSNLQKLSFYKPLAFPKCEQMMPIINLMWYWCFIHPFGKLYNKYETVFRGYEINTESIKSERLKEASNFSIIEEIFSMENRMYLELKNEINKLKKELCPIGTIQAFAFDSVPYGWIECDGRSLYIENYPALYKAIGIVFGGDGENYFSLPDLRGRFVRGWDKNGAIDAQRKFGSLQEDSIQGHSHSINIEAIKVEENGQHDHDLYWAKFNVRDPSTFDSNNHTQQIPIPYEEREKAQFGRKDTKFVMRDGTELIGKHTHQLSIKGCLIGQPTDSEFGSTKDKVTKETRPKNIALLFCIRAK